MWLKPRVCTHAEKKKVHKGKKTRETTERQHLKKQDKRRTTTWNISTSTTITAGGKGKKNKCKKHMSEFWIDCDNIVASIDNNLPIA